MKKKTIIAVLIVIIVFQITVLMSEYFGAVYPLWTGREITLRTAPWDPRSLFRGNYARLRYDITSIDKKDLDTAGLRNGEVVYVKLKPGTDGVYEFDGASLDKPESGIFIKGRIQGSRWGSIRNVRYGIEAFFAPREKAIALENELRKGGVAIVMIAGNGKAALKDVIPKEMK